MRVDSKKHDNCSDYFLRYGAICSGLLTSALMLLMGWQVSFGAPLSGPTVTLNRHHFRVELALTAEALSRGLMFREHLDSDQGMLFVHTRPRYVQYWMKNTLIPLDILYFDEDAHLVQIYPKVPPCEHNPCAVYPSQMPVQYVLELNAGTVERIGAQLGDYLTVPRELVPRGSMWQ